MVKEHFHPEVHRVWGGKVKLYRGFREAMFVSVNTKCLQYTSTRAHTWFKLPQVILPGNGSRFLTLSWTPLEHEITDATDFIYKVANESFQPNHRTGTFLRIDGWRRSFRAAPPWWSVWKPAWVKSKVSMDKNKELEYVVCSLSEVTSSSSVVSVFHTGNRKVVSVRLCRSTEQRLSVHSPVEPSANQLRPVLWITFFPWSSSPPPPSTTS